MRILCKIRVVRLVWVVIPLVLIGIIGMQESFAEDSPHISIVTKNGLQLTLETDKSEYVKGEIIDIRLNITNISSEVIKYQTRSTCHDGIDFDIFDSSGNSLILLLPTASNIKQNDPLIKKFDSVSFYGKILELIKTDPDKELGLMITGDKDEIENILRAKHGVTEIGKAKNLGFVGAKVQAKEIPEIAGYDFVRSITDGEQRVCGHAMGVEFLTPNESIEKRRSWSQLVPSVIKGEAPHRVPEGQYLIKIEFHGIVNCLTIELEGDKPDLKESDISCGQNLLPPLDQDTETIFETIFPDWIKNNAKWWAEGKIDDESFVNGIQYLINEKIIHVPKFDVKKKTLTNHSHLG